MNKRIYKYSKENNIFSENQSGFMESRTEDNIFVLNTSINSHVICKKQKRFAVFVDFSKFSYCMNRNMLCYKLLQLGNMYTLIKSMYSKCKYCIKTEKGITKQFSSTTGVKQGCNLSLCMSNLYQNDLHILFDET